MVAVSKLTSLIEALQFPFGQPAALAETPPGPGVVSQNETVPFLIWEALMVWVTLAATATLFCPGAVLPPGLTHVVDPVPVVVTVMVISWFPSPASEAHAVKVVPLSVKVGCVLK